MNQWNSFIMTGKLLKATALLTKFITSPIEHGDHAVNRHHIVFVSWYFDKIGIWLWSTEYWRQCRQMRDPPLTK